jgi:hypothetical protein
VGVFFVRGAAQRRIRRAAGASPANRRRSFGIATKAQRATQWQEAYGGTCVPALGIAGRFRTDGSLAVDTGPALTEADRLV